jgi:hypothetical protein
MNDPKVPWRYGSNANNPNGRDERVAALYQAHQQDLFVATERLFLGLLVFQYLLALNAAIEAAREISALTSSSVRVAERSGDLLKDLVPAIRKTAELVQEVATSSREQAAGVAQVNRAMTQVDKVTQYNAGAAEKLSSTADQMAAQAESLQKLMQQRQSTVASKPEVTESDDRRAALHLRRSLSAKNHTTHPGNEVLQPAASRLKDTESHYTGMNSY